MLHKNFPDYKRVWEYRIVKLLGLKQPRWGIDQHAIIWVV